MERSFNVLSQHAGYLNCCGWHAGKLWGGMSGATALIAACIAVSAWLLVVLRHRHKKQTLTDRVLSHLKASDTTTESPSSSQPDQISNSNIHRSRCLRPCHNRSIALRRGQILCKGHNHMVHGALGRTIWHQSRHQRHGRQARHLD